MAEAATKDEVREVMSAFEAFKETNDKRLTEIATKAAPDPITVEKLAKIEQALDAGEKKNQELTAEVQQTKLKTQQTLDALEVKLNRFGIGGNGGPPMDREEKRARVMDRADQWARAVDIQIKLSAAHLSDDQRAVVDAVAAEYKALNISDDTSGGFLAPVDFVAEILKSVVLISPVRSLARVRTTALKEVKLPRRTGLLSAVWEDEEQLTSTTAQNGLKYGLITVYTKGLRALVDISNDMLEDSAFDMGAEILSEVSEQFAVSEGAAFVNGSGPGQPEGFLVNKDVIAAGNVTKTGNATQLTADSFIACYHALKTAYARNGVWAMNRATVGAARQLKDSVGQYLFMMGLPNGAPNTFLGSPYVEVPDMPAVGAGAYPVAFGDFNKGYSLIDRISMQMLRDPYTQAVGNNVRYLFRKRLAGQVTMAEAIQPLLVST
jgi:HK97 family phage major capsid protein